MKAASIELLKTSLETVSNCYRLRKSLCTSLYIFDALGVRNKMVKKIENLNPSAIISLILTIISYVYINFLIFTYLIKIHYS